MLLPTAQIKTKDFRANPRADKACLNAGTQLYALVDRSDPNVKGPYFLYPNTALLFGFLRGLSLVKNYPVLVNPAIETIYPNHVQGKMFTNWSFPSNYVLVEVKADENIVFDNMMVDANMSDYVDHKFGAHDPNVKKNNVNVDDEELRSEIIRYFDGFPRWTVSNKESMCWHNTLLMLPQWIFTSEGTKRFDDGTIDYYNSLKMFSITSLLVGNSKNDVKNFVQLQEPVYRVSKPHETFSSKNIYEINWEKVYLSFISLRSQKSFFTYQELKIAFNTLAGFYEGSYKASSFPILDVPLVISLVKYFETLKDAVAFFSTNRRHRKFLKVAAVQQLLFWKFLPERSMYFNDLPIYGVGKDRHLVGFPKTKHAYSGNLWMGGCVFFKENLPNLKTKSSLNLAVVEKLNNSSGSQPAISAAEQVIQKVIDRQIGIIRTLSMRQQENVDLPDDLFASDNSDLELDINYNEFIDLTKTTNSFVSLILMMISCSRGDESIKVTLKLKIPAGNNDMSMTIGRTARPWCKMDSSILGDLKEGDFTDNVMANVRLEDPKDNKFGKRSKTGKGQRKKRLDLGPHPTDREDNEIESKENEMVVSNGLRGYNIDCVNKLGSYMFDLVPGFFLLPGFDQYLDAVKRSYIVDPMNENSKYLELLFLNQDESNALVNASLFYSESKDKGECLVFMIDDDLFKELGNLAELITQMKAYCSCGIQKLNDDWIGNNIELLTLSEAFSNSGTRRFSLFIFRGAELHDFLYVVYMEAFLTIRFLVHSSSKTRRTKLTGVFNPKSISII